MFEGGAEAALARVLAKLGMKSRLELILDYKRAPLALAHKVDGLSPYEPVVVIETDATLHFGDALTPAQEAVARLVVQGYSNSEIAGLRNTSNRTVANQVRQVFQRCRVHSRAELLVAALSEPEN